MEILCHMLASEQPRLSSHVPSASMPSTTRQTQRLPLICPFLFYFSLFFFFVFVFLFGFFLFFFFFSFFWEGGRHENESELLKTTDSDRDQRALRLTRILLQQVRQKWWLFTRPTPRIASVRGFHQRGCKQSTASASSVVPKRGPWRTA